MEQTESSALQLEQLRNGVLVSIESNHALSAIASLNREIVEVNDRSRTIAAAAEEMVASVREISGNSEAAATDSRAVSDAVERGR